MGAVNGRKQLPAKEDTVVRSFKLGADLDKQLTEKADKLGMSRNFLVNAAVERLFDTDKK